MKIRFFRHSAQLLTTLLERPSVQIALLLAIALIPRAVLTPSTFAIVWPDSFAYVRSANLIAKYGDFVHHVIYRTPFYPLFLSGFMLLFKGSAPFWIITAQRLLGIGSGLLLFAIGRRMMPRGLVPFCAAVLFLTMQRQLYYETTVLTETLFTFLLHLSVLSALPLLDRDSVESKGLLRYMTVGVLFALLTLTRPIGQFLLPLFLVLAFARVGRKALPGAAAALIAFFMVISPWLEINHRYFKFWGVSRDQGLNLYHRVIDIDGTEPKSETETALPKVLELYRTAKKRPGVTYFSVYYGMLKHKVSPVDADALMGRFALETLLHRPGSFVPNSIRTFLQFFLNTRRSVMLCAAGNQPKFLCSKIQAKAQIKGFSDVPDRLSITGRKAVHFYFGHCTIPDWVIGALALAGIVSVLRVRPFLSDRSLPLLLTIFYFAALTALFNRPEDRFRIPVDGFIWLYACVAISVYVIPLLPLIARLTDRESAAEGLPAGAEA